jgi:hypothetical protein
VERAEAKVFAKREHYKKHFDHATSPKSLEPIIHVFRKSFIHTPHYLEHQDMLNKVINALSAKAP